MTRQVGLLLQDMSKFSLNPLRALLGGADEDLMVRVKTTDDPRAFAMLVARWEEPIRRLCSRMLGDAHRGDDLKQETFARLFAKRDKYQPSGRFSTYLWRIALNLCHDELRRVNRRRELFQQVEPEDDRDPMADCAADDPGPDVRVVESEEGAIVRRALLRLPELYRTVLILRHYEQLKLTDIAEALEIPLGTVNSRMAEALARLTRLLEPEFDRPDAAKPVRRPESLIL